MENSRQYSFIHNQNGFTVSIIEGNQLINDLSKIHNIGPFAREFYVKTVLSSLQMINFLKAGENLGFYIDSEEPYFRFKIELSHNGALRTLLLPEEFDNFPNALTGKCRIHKIFQGREPYTSILEFKEHPLEGLVDEVMEKSYQTRSKIIMLKDCSSSIMLTKLPPSNVNKKIEDFDDLSLAQIEEKYQELFQNTLRLIDPDIKTMEQLFAKHELHYLGSKEVKFHCPCSHERMVENIFTLPKEDRMDFFKDDSTIETRCDYCNTTYEITKDEIIKELH